MAGCKRVLCALSRFYFSFAVLVAASFEFTLPDLHAQTPTQQRVYASASITSSTSALPVYTKNDTTGALTLVGNAPFADRLEGGLLAIDGLGKFLFVLNPVSNNISMYQIDSSTGALIEVPNSPFAAGTTINPNLAPSLPVSLATEKSGNFLYVGYANGDSATTSALVPFAIDTANLRLVLTPELSLDFPNGAPIQMLTDSKGLRLYVGFGPAPYQSTPGAGTTVYSIDSSNGVLTPSGNAGGGSDWGRAIAIDPQGRFFFDAWGQTEGFLDSGLISPVDGTSGANFTVRLGANVFPSVLIIESSGKFLYVQTQPGLLIYSIDQASGALTLLSGPLSSFAFGKGTVAADPMGPYVYSLGRSGIDVFQIEPVTGNLAEIPKAPFGTGVAGALGSLGLAISGTPTQNATGAAAQLFPSSTDFGSGPLAKTSATKIVSLVNTGDQILAVNGISITGTNAGDFAQSNTCSATLAPNANCSISVGFTPSQAGVEQATLEVADNAAGSPQTAVVVGTGVATTPSVTISPANLDFGTVLEGATVAAKSVQVTNSGSNTLHVSGVAMSGSNPGDFSQTNTCIAAAVATQASCSITVNFKPVAEGQRSASLVLTDDAANSPQSIPVTGSLVSPFQITTAPSGSTSANVPAGQPAQYALQLEPGSGYTGTVTVTCSGAPPGAGCSANPATITVSNGTAIPFEVTVTTSSDAFMAPPGFISPLGMTFGKRMLRLRSGTMMILISTLLALMLVVINGRELNYLRNGTIRFAGIATMAMLLLGLSGCGGGTSSKILPNRITTPPGTSAIMVTATSGSLTPQSIQLSLTVH